MAGRQHPSVFARSPGVPRWVRAHGSRTSSEPFSDAGCAGPGLHINLAYPTAVDDQYLGAERDGGGRVGDEVVRDAVNDDPHLARSVAATHRAHDRADLAD